MKRLFGLLLLFLAQGALADQITVQEIRTWTGPEHTRVVFDISGPVSYRLFTLTGPDRVVMDLRDTAMEPVLTEGAERDGVLLDIRSAPRNGDDLRVVLDLGRSVRPQSFLLRPNEKYGHRLVVDLEKPASDGQPVKTLAETRDGVLIAVDAGHGGEDPGAIGTRGTYEKDVVLEVARKLADLIDQQPGMSALMIREGDYYLGLRERTIKAQEAGADMFVSIHADAFRDHDVRGSSVYILSRNGASSEMARLLARRENASDRIGGVSLEDKDDLVASVLVDLSRAATIESSAGLAQAVLGELDELGPVHSERVERAAFVVLKSLDMPSMLVELAFISNPVEERKLRSDSYQWELARAVRDGIVGYAVEHLPGIHLAESHQHVVRSGDTLTEIARRYGVSVTQLKAANELNGDIIVAGSRLVIP